MGLSQRKDKQKIAPDPRNLGWSQDTNRFSYQHLAKFGWDPTQGLGSENNQGNREHIKVVRKLDSSGIGVARAIKEGAEVGGAGEGLNSLFARLRKGGSAHEAGSEGGSGASTPMVFNTSDEDDEQENKPSATTTTTIISPTPLSLGNSSRSKYVRSKRLAASSPAAMAEILGIPIASLPASPSPLSQPPQAGPSTLKPRVPEGNGSSDPFADTPADEDDEEKGKHTVAKISVAEYFRRRLAQKKAEREGAEVPVFDDEKPGGGYSEVAKGFEGKKIVFASNDAEEESVDEDIKPKIEEDDDDMDRAEGGVGGAGLGSAGDANKVRSEAVSPALTGEGRRERKDREKKERKEREKMEKRERKEKEKREKKEKKKGKGKEGQTEAAGVVVKMEEDEPVVVVKSEPGVDESSVRVKQEEGVDGSSTDEKKRSGKKRKRSGEEEQVGDETEVRVKKEKKSKKEVSFRVPDGRVKVNAHASIDVVLFAQKSKKSKD